MQVEGSFQHCMKQHEKGYAVGPHIWFFCSICGVNLPSVVKSPFPAASVMHLCHPEGVRVTFNPSQFHVLPLLSDTKLNSMLWFSLLCRALY